MKDLSTKIGQTMTTREIAELTGKWQIPQDFAQALQLAADIQQKLEDAQLQIEQYKPLIALSRATSAKGYITRRKWCKRLKHQGCSITERKLTKWLMAEGYCHKDQLTGDTRAYAKYDHLLTPRVELINGYARTLLVVTDAGVRKLSAKVLRHFISQEEI